MVPFLPAPELFDILGELKRSRTGLGQKVDRAANALRETSEFIDELQSELQERTERVARLKTEHEKYSQLAQIEEKKARALVNELRGILSSGKGRERLVTLGLNLLAGAAVFTLGVIFGPLLKGVLGLK